MNHNKYSFHFVNLTINKRITALNKCKGAKRRGCTNLTYFLTRFSGSNMNDQFTWNCLNYALIYISIQYVCYLLLTKAGHSGDQVHPRWRTWTARRVLAGVDAKRIDPSIHMCAPMLLNGEPGDIA